MSCLGYYQDGSNPSDTGTANPGFTTRANIFKDSKSRQFITNIDADLFNQELYLMNNVEIDIEITPQTDNFIIIQKTPAAVRANNDAPLVTPADKKYTLEIMDCRLYVKTLELMDGLSLGMNYVTMLRNML